MATTDGRLTAPLVDFYGALAAGGVGAVTIGTCWPLSAGDNPGPHIALASDGAIPDLANCVDRIHHGGACALVLIDQPVDCHALGDDELLGLTRAWVAAAQRASSAGADGIMVSCADNGLFHYLLSPRSNGRAGAYGGSLERRMRLLLETVEKLQARFGTRMFIGVRLLAEEFVSNGMTLQDARVVARRLSVAGVRLIDVCAPATGSAPMAQFPGWRAPLAAAIRTVVDVPVMVGDLNDDPEFADSILAERSADLVSLDEALTKNPNWPVHARSTLETD